MQNRNNLIDIILGVVIVVSLSFIGYSVFNRRAVPVPAKVVAPIPNTKLPAIVTPTNRINVIRKGAAAQMILTSLKPLTGPQWSALTKNLHSSTETESCKQPASPREAGLTFFNPQIVENIKRHELHFVFDWLGRCFAVGDTLEVVLVSDEPDSKFMSLHGHVKIQSLVDAPIDKLSDSLLAEMGIAKKELTSLAQSMNRPLARPLTIVRFEDFEPPKANPKLPVRSFNRYRVFGRKEMAALKAAGKSFVVIDVRDDAAAKAIPIAGAKRLPVELAASKSSVFSWDTTARELQGLKIDSAALIELKNSRPDTALVIVGADPTDARPIWTLDELLKLGIDNAIWFYDGSAVLNEVISKAN